MCIKPILFSNIPKSALLVLIFSALYSVSALSSAVAEFIDAYVCFVIRSFAAFFTNLLPFSFFEVLVLSFFAIIVAISFRRALISDPRPLSEIAVAISVFLLAAYTVTLGIPSNVVNSYPLREKFTDSEILYTVQRFADGLNVDFTEEEISVDEVYPSLLSDIKKYAGEELRMSVPILPRAKESLLSSALGRIGTHAYYCFMSAETVYDAKMPTPLAVFSIAHEAMHFLGVVREDEANFHAARLCMASENQYIRYCGTLAAYRYTATALCMQNPEAYRKVLRTVSDGVRQSISECNEFSSRYKGSLLRKISKDTNAALVKARCAQGVGAYSDTARRILSYTV